MAITVCLLLASAAPAGATVPEEDAARAAAADAPTDGADGDGADGDGADMAAVDPSGAGRDARAGEDGTPGKVGAREADVAALCRLMQGAADRHGVPHDFFIRLIWKESRFDPNAVSPVGAQGIAQFMPGTARLRGLDDPFDREEALFASAHFLADLKARFGFWGLAAAGYNGGPNRVPPFVAGEGTLPFETRDYVFSITGRTAEYWARRAREAAGLPDPDAALAPAAVSGGEDAGPVSAVRALAGRLEAAAEGQDRAAAPGARPRDLRGEAAGQSAAGAAGEAVGGGDAAGTQAGRGPVSAGTGPGAAREGVPLAAAVAVAVPRPRPDYEPAAVDCPRLVARLGQARSVPLPSAMGTGWTRWGAQVAGHPKRTVALRQYERVKARLPADLVRRGPTIVVRRFAARGRLPIHSVMFAAAGQAEARAMCKRIAAARAPCVVVKNP